jgi:hypothetical protein
MSLTGALGNVDVTHESHAAFPDRPFPLDVVRSFSRGAFTVHLAATIKVGQRSRKLHHGNLQIEMCSVLSRSATGLYTMPCRITGIGGALKAQKHGTIVAATADPQSANALSGRSLSRPSMCDDLIAVNNLFDCSTSPGPCPGRW